jgi:nicotinamidase-related amidase
VIKKHRYSAFFGTDLDIILREWGVDTDGVIAVVSTASRVADRHDNRVGSGP